MTDRWGGHERWGKPIADLPVTITEQDGRLRLELVTDERGHIEADLPEGRYWVQAPPAREWTWWDHLVFKVTGRVSSRVYADRMARAQGQATAGRRS